MALCTGFWFRLGLGLTPQDRWRLDSSLLLVGPKLEKIVELLAINPVHQLVRCLWMDGLLEKPTYRSGQRGGYYSIRCYKKGITYIYIYYILYILYVHIIYCLRSMGLPSKVDCGSGLHENSALTLFLLLSTQLSTDLSSHGYGFNNIAGLPPFSYQWFMDEVQQIYDIHIFSNCANKWGKAQSRFSAVQSQGDLAPFPLQPFLR